MKTESIFSLSDISYVHRVIVGCNKPDGAFDDNKYKEQIALVNRCLNTYPKGKIIGVEKNFLILNVGEHQAILQYLVYHIGFKRKPDYLTES